MTPTEEQRERIHDITYSTQDREELAERIVALEDENARLRSMRDGWQGNDANLREENAKLRKIVREQAANIEGYSCNECPYGEDCDLDTVPMHDGCRMYAEMQEMEYAEMQRMGMLDE